MKQPKSLATIRVKVPKKPMLPSFRQSRHMSKLQQSTTYNKSEITFNIKLIPLEIVLEEKSGNVQKILVSHQEILVQQEGKSHREQFTIQGRQWLHISFGASYARVKVKKIGDENVFGKNLFQWEKPQVADKKEMKIIDIAINQNFKNQANGLEIDQSEDKNKQMKQFVATMMAKKLHRRSTEKNEFSKKLSIRKNSGLIKNRISGIMDSTVPSEDCKNIPSTLTIGSELCSLKKQLAESKFTRKSQRQTSIGGDQSTLIGLKPNVTLNVSINNDTYIRRKMKFDSQPYFQQNSTFSSNFGDDKINTQHNFTTTHSKQNKTETLEIKDNCLQDQSLHNSEVEQSVEQQIQRSGIADSKQINSFQSGAKREKKDRQSSECCQSREIESSGTLYESKYQ